MAILEHFTQKGQEGEGERAGNSLVLALVLSTMCLAALSLMLVWLNLQRMQMGYRMRELNTEVESLTEFSAKLAVEREHLLSRIGERAREMGLAPAKPGQTRRMDGISGSSTLD